MYNCSKMTRNKRNFNNPNRKAFFTRASTKRGKKNAKFPIEFLVLAVATRKKARKKLS